MRILWIVFLGLTVAACAGFQTPQERADDLHCLSYGSMRGTPQYTQCRSDIESRRLTEKALQSGNPVILNR